jgi:hypothetical protein
MLYRDISLVCVFGLRGNLYIEKSATAEGVSVQAEGPYEAKVAEGFCLMIYPEGHEPQLPLRSRTDITAGQTHVGSVDVAASTRFLSDSGPRAKARGSARVKATVRITVPPHTTFELIRCSGLRKDPRGWRFMRGNSRFDIR